MLLLVMGFLWFGCATARAADAVPATAYFPVFPYNAQGNAPPQFVPVAANHKLDGVHRGITRAIIVIHGSDRDANDALAGMASLAGAANAETMIVAPQFLLPSDIARVAAHLPDQGQLFAAWQANDWPYGGNSSATPPQQGISSFTVIDLLLMYVSDPDVFPDMKTVVVAGAGTGADFVQRYAAFSRAAAPLAKQDINLRFIVAGAHSYLYMTENRMLGGRNGFGQPDVKVCPAYDAYPYGLENLNPYAGRAGANAAKLDYATRFITYLNAPGGNSEQKANCAVLDQGATAAVRAKNFRLYLRSIYSGVASRTQVFSFDHSAKGDALGLFGSSCGMEVLFGDGMCPEVPESAAQ
ncbi:MAG: hypothetical protein KGI97_05665 [Alphaproteobacteria bacterium]|nr:hypothetical protein [Alphaproteobacteria bacterium]